jgi:hypothetical protein
MTRKRNILRYTVIIFFYSYVKQIIVAVIPSVAQRLANDILSTNDGILAISIMNMRGNILASTSKESFKEDFGVSREGDKYGGTLAVAALAVANEVKDVAGEAQALITIYKNCKMMLLPMPSHEILAGFVLRPSVNAEDYNIANKIEILLADAIESSQ